jgi:hypothetical protein
VNGGIPEVWHDESVALWHFAHPNPLGASGQSFSWKLWLQVAYPHLQAHALTAVEAFSTGRLLPLKENSEVHKLRMAQRQIGTSLEERCAWMTGPAGFSKWDRLKLHLSCILEPIYRMLLQAVEKLVGSQKYDELKAWWHSLKGQQVV